MLDVVSGGAVKAKINGSSPYAFLKGGAIRMVLPISEPKTKSQNTNPLFSYLLSGLK